MRARPLAVLLPALLVASCTKPVEPPAILESFDLVSIDGDPLPAEAGPEGTSDIFPFEEQFEIREDETVRLVLRYVEVLVSGSAMPERTRREVFEHVVFFGDSVRVSTEAGCVIDECTIARGTKIGDALTLIRPKWSGSRVFAYTRTPAM